MKTHALLCILAALAGDAFAQADAARAKQCGDKLEQARKLDLFYRHETRGGALRIYVGPTYFRVPIDAKEGFAETVSCFLVNGDRKQCANFELYHWTTGQMVGRFENCLFKPV